MDVYLPIANLSVNALVIVALGAGVGLLSGMFGVGGGFLTTPLLIVYGISPTVAAATSASQVTGSCVSGVVAHFQRRGVDLKMGATMVSGGVFGTALGAWLFRWLQSTGQIDTVIALIYVVLLGSIGILMARESLQSIGAMRNGRRPQARRRRHHPIVAALPFRTRYYRSGLYISPLAPMLLGCFAGVMTTLLGIGGGFILIPAMLYILGMSTAVVVGTSLFQTLFVTSIATMAHATGTKSVDIVLAALLLLGSVTGAQIGVRLAVRIKPEYLRLMLAVMVLLVAARMAIGLGWRPSDLFTVELA
ncbi:MAG: sulfite exporter TauE/SafE family protein [Sphingomonas sp.]